MWRAFFRQTTFGGRRRYTNRSIPASTNTSNKKKTLSLQLQDENSQTKENLKVINLSHHILSKPQREVLSKGLSFSPVDKYDYFTTIKDLELFARKLIFKKYFKSSDMQPSTATEKQALQDLKELARESEITQPASMPKQLYPRSTAFPPLSACPQVDIFVRLVRNDLSRLEEKISRDNLSHSQRRAIRELRQMKDVVIKRADKGGNVVIWPSQDYEKEAFKQLNNNTCYKRLDSIPLLTFQRELINLLDDGVESFAIPVKMKEALLPEFPVIPTFYLLPKVHKDPLCPPGRPIVSGMGGLCEPICQFVDFFLKQCVETIPSYVKDTTDVLRKLDGITLEADMWFVTCDVESLYTSIQHSDGITAARFFLEMTNSEPVLIDFILELLEFILTHNFFVFKDRPYLQLQGTAMGVSCAPSYANLFLGLWERDTVLETPGHESVISWSRYIDDVLFIWQGSTSQLDNFLHHLNNNQLNIKLTYKYSQSCIDFLDLLITRMDDGRIGIDIFRKETSTNSLLHFTSSHPPKLKSSIPIGQYLRARRICSSDDKFDYQAQDLSKRFLNRGYNIRDVNKAYFRAKNSDRQSLLVPIFKPKIGESIENSYPRFIATFNNNWTDIRKILMRHWSVLLTDKDLKSQLPNRPVVTWRKSNTLSDLITNSHYIPPKKFVLS
ncbi:uncharacterized protein [Phyllobates terribilis]|uniref:uncharacterized protein n=1 Tax=Phyllobates terribilis TaxID=111132 RepID=UPI003CCB0648